jgi:hypothetical protein
MWFRPPERNTLCPRDNGVVLLKPGLARVSRSLFSSREYVSDPCEELSVRAFYSSRLGSYIETWGPTSGPEMVETLYSI